MERKRKVKEVQSEIQIDLDAIKIRLDGVRKVVDEMYGTRPNGTIKPNNFDRWRTTLRHNLNEITELLSEKDLKEVFQKEA